MINSHLTITFVVVAILLAPFYVHETSEPSSHDGHFSGEQLVYPIYGWRRTTSGWEKVRLPAPGEEDASAPQFIIAHPPTTTTQTAPQGTRHLNPILATIAIALISQIALKRD